MEISSIINLSIYGLVAVFALFRFLRGVSGGMAREVLRVITVAGAAAITYVACMKIYPLVFNYVTQTGVNTILDTYSIPLNDTIKGFIDCVDSETAALVLALPVMLVIIPVLFIILFFLLSFVLKLVHVILCGIFGFSKKRNNAFTRLLGGALGLVHGALIALVVLMPIAGTLGVVSNTVHHVKDNYADAQNENAELLCNAYDTYLAQTEENVIVQTLNGQFGTFYTNMITVNIGEEETKLDKVVCDGAEIFVLAADLKGINASELTEDNKAAINAILDCFGDDKYMTSVLAGVLRALPRAVDRGLIKFNFEEPALTLINSFMPILESSNSSNIKQDIRVLLDVYFIVSDSGILSSGAELDPLDLLSQKDENGRNIINRIIDTVESNARFNGVMASLSDMAVHVLLENSGLSPEVAETVDSIKNTLNDVIAIDKDSYATEEEYKEAVSDKIGGVLEEYSIPLEKEQLDVVTDFVCTELEGKEEITETDLAEFMAKYYEVYTSGELPEDFPVELPDELPDEIPDGILDGIIGGGSDSVEG